MLKLLEKENLGLDDIASAKPRQVLVCLCLDCSYSMRTNGKIDQLDNGNLKITKKDRLKITNYGEKTKSIWLSFHFVYT